MDENIEQRITNKFNWFKPYSNELERKINTPYYCECDNGWFKLIYDMCEDIDNLYKNKNKNINSLNILQIKEKYGELRVYLSEYISGVHQIVDEYEQKSLKTCELCGEKGQLCIKNSWFKTLCKRCMEEKGYNKCKI